MTSVTTLRHGLERMTEYWSGISWILGALERRAAGIPRNNIDLLAAQEKLAPFISQPDMVMIDGRSEQSTLGHSGAGFADFDLSQFDLPFTAAEGLEAVSTAGLQMSMFRS